MKITVIVLTLGLAMSAYPASSVRKFGGMRAALDAMETAQSEDERDKIAAELQAYPAQNAEDVRAIYKAMKNAETRCKNREQGEHLKLQVTHLHKLLSLATGDSVKSTIVSLLEQENSELPPNYYGAMGITDQTKAVREMIRVRRIAALTEAAGKGKNEAALPILRTIASRGGISAEMAERAIAEVGKAEDLDRLIERIERDPQARVDLTGFGPAIIDRIMRDVDDPGIPDDQKKRLILRLDQAIGRDSTSKYEALLHHKDPKVVEIAARAVALSAEPGNHALVGKMLGDKDRQVRFGGLAMLEDKTWSKSYVPQLIQLLHKDDDDGVRELAAHILGKRKVQEAKTDIEQALHDPSGRVRSAAKGALENLNGEYDERIRKYVDEVKKNSRKPK